VYVGVLLWGLLMIYPYFIPDVIALVAIGAVLIAVPYFFKV